MSDFLHRAAVAYETHQRRMAAWRAKPRMDAVAPIAWPGIGITLPPSAPRPVGSGPPRAADLAVLTAFVGCNRDRLIVTESFTAGSILLQPRDTLRR